LRSKTPQNQNREAVLIRARDRSGILLFGLPGKRYKRIARFFAVEPQKMRPNAQKLTALIALREALNAGDNLENPPPSGLCFRYGQAHHQRREGAQSQKY
jgi:hypothetical protein